MENYPKIIPLTFLCGALSSVFAVMVSYENHLLAKKKKKKIIIIDNDNNFGGKQFTFIFRYTRVYRG